MKTVGADWLDRAKRLPVGQKRRAYHDCKAGATKSNFEYGNEPEFLWAKCHRCGFSKRHDKTHVQYSPPVRRQVSTPTDLTPLIELVAKYPYQLRKVLEQQGLLPYLSQLKGSHEFGRLYLPDDSASYCGLDFSGDAYAFWHSPHGHNLAYTHGTHDLFVYGTAADYMHHLSEADGEGVMFLPNLNSETMQASVALLLAGHYDYIWLCNHPSAKRLKKELSIAGTVRVI